MLDNTATIKAVNEARRVSGSDATDCSAVGRVCDVCGCEALIIVKGHADLWEAMSFDQHPDRENVDHGDTDWSQDHDHDTASHFAHACPLCRRIVPGSHWIDL